MAEREAKDQAAYDKAEKVDLSTYTGFVYVDGCENFMDTDDLEDYLEDSLAEFVHEGGDPDEWALPRVYATYERQAYIDTDGAIEAALDESHEDAISEVLHEVIDELRDYLTTWSETHLPTSRISDMGKALVVQEST